MNNVKFKFLNFLLFFLCLCSSYAQAPFPMYDKPTHQGIGVKNAILAKINGKTISVIDVMKKMDMSFYKNFPHLVDSQQARYQFYMTSWKHILNEMIDSQLILADAEAKEIKVEDAEIRKEMERKFGPNTLLTLDEIGLTYDEAWDMTEEEMLVQRMSWFRVNSKAFQQVTPKAIKKEFVKYCQENPPKKQWEYETISVRSSDEEASREIAKNIANFISTHSDMTDIKNHLKTLEEKEQNCKIQLSNSYAVDESALSNTYKTVLQSLKKNTFSEPLLQKNKNSYCYRLFHLKDFLQESAPAFEELYSKLEDKVLHNAISYESRKYIDKLREYYSYDQQKIKLADDFVPFVLE